ncbi:MAG: response regulator [Vicinamibacterales bacterium]|jgi:PAS domain S-box-containing protein
MTTDQRANGKAEILIAEDSPTQAVQLAHLLEQNGYSVTTAANGREALASIERHKPALVITDIVMPELDGYGLCKAIKADEQLKGIPVMLLTTLSDPRDLIRGLECGADNFLRKPYDERYLLSRIDYLLMNLALRKNQKMQMGMEIDLGGQKHFISSERQQILDLLISTYEQAIEINSELKQREKDLAHSSEVLAALYRIAEGLNRAGTEREVVETVLERAMELPGIQAGWISLREGESGFRLGGARNLPPALEAAGAMEGDCACRRRLVSGELDHVTNIMACERLGKATGDTRGLCYHAAVPLWLGDRTLGVMNLVGPEKGLFNEAELKILYGVGNQVAVALERAHLHEHLERLVHERTAALEAEIVERKRIEKEQARLVAIIEATPDLVATGGPNGHVLYYNRAGLRMLGFEPGLDPSTVRFLDTHPEWAAKLVAETGIPHAIEHGAWSGETALLRRDGHEIPVSQAIIAHKRPDGSVEYLSTIARDITQQKKHEKIITRLNRVYAVLSGINTTIVRTRDRQELFDEACRIAVEEGEFRLAWIGLLDANGVDVMPVARAGVDEGYLDSIQLTARDGAPDRCELLAWALREKTAVVCNDIDTDPRMARWRADALPRGYRSVVVFPLQFGDKVLGVLALYASETNFFDTKEMQLLTELAGDVSFALDHIDADESRHLQSAALNAAANAIVVTDRSGTIEWVNRAFTALTGYAAVDVLGKNSRILKSDKHDRAFYQSLWDTVLSGRTWRAEITNRRKDGSLYSEDLSITPVLSESGAITHFVAVKEDITERLQLQAQFRQAQKMESVGQLASGIAHDFNNLLTVINGMADLVLEQVSQDDPVHADVREIHRAGERAATLTRQLLAFSRQQLLEPRVMDFNTVVAGMESLLRRLLGEDIDLVIVPAPGLGTVKADPGQIEQVITNLAVNARDAMPQGGRLTIETQNVTIDEDDARQRGATGWSGPYVLLAVSDGGAGMDEATRTRVFEPFFTTKGPGKGTGLGLSTVYGIVKQSHGFIWVDSEVGRGTSFKIYLPQVTTGAASTARPGPTVVSSSGTEAVLLVEDNVALSMLATRVLERAGYTVLGAATGEEALRLLERHEEPVHLLLSDVVMPGMSGRQLSEQLAQTHPGMKVLYMSGYTGDTIVRHGVLEAQTPFLNKPFTATALLRKVREVLDL